MNIGDIKIDSILSDRDISDLVYSFFLIGKRTATTAIAWHSGEKIDAYYYDCSLKEVVEKENALGISEEDFLNLICRWRLFNREIQRIGEKCEGIMDTDKMKYRESIKQRDGLWGEIERVLKCASPLAHFTSSLNEDSAKIICKELISKGYLDEKTNENDFLYRLGVIEIPDSNSSLKWVKTNSTTNNKVPNKKSLLDFLSLIGVPDREISNRTLVNDVFEIPQGGVFRANNYTYTGNRLNVMSEYHSELEMIVNKNK